MGLRKILRIFKNGSVLVCGVRGGGKDTLFANVVALRKKPYVSMTDYGGLFIPFDYKAIDLNGNTYTDFIEGTVKYFDWPYEDGTDFYMPDSGVYFPSQFCNELNRKYPQLPIVQALIRHLGLAGWHTNVQRPGRVWDKIREQYDNFIMCKWCKWIGNLVIQKVVIYDRYEAFSKDVPPFPLPKPLFNVNRRFQWKIQYTNYLISHGEIKSMILIYFNKSKFNTRAFKEMMLNGKKNS